MRKIIDLTKEYTEDELEEFMCDLEASMEKEQGRFLKKLEGKSPKEILDAFAEQYMIQARIHISLDVGILMVLIIILHGKQLILEKQKY